jgi:hypothetical protein
MPKIIYKKKLKCLDNGCKVEYNNSMTKLNELVEFLGKRVNSGEASLSEAFVYGGLLVIRNELTNEKGPCTELADNYQCACFPESTAFKGAVYNRGAKELKLKFRTGGEITFSDIRQQVADNFFNAESKGRYYHFYLKGVYPVK